MSWYFIKNDTLIYQWTEDEQTNVPVKEVWCYLEVAETM